jgi:hypothetical protein
MLRNRIGVGSAFGSWYPEGKGPLLQEPSTFASGSNIFPAVGSRLQSSRVKGVIRKTEITRVAIAEVGWQTVHEFCNGSVKLMLIIMFQFKMPCMFTPERAGGYRSWNFDPPLFLDMTKSD